MKILFINLPYYGHVVPTIGLVQELYENEVYAGVPEMLQTLKEQGKKIILATSKPEEQLILYWKN